MTAAPQYVALLGATGSIGRSTLDVIAASEGRYQCYLLTAHQKLDELAASARQFVPRYVVATDAEAAASRDWSDLPPETELRTGPDAIADLVGHDDVDIVVAAIVGRAGLEGTWAALEAGKRVALANKETLVLAGGLAMRLAAERNAPILPVDSEHSAIFQALQSGKETEVARIILTASGGPFRNHTQAQLEQVTTAEALNHPTWKMGPKITIDSATMMNKALEVIEARWLFDMPAEKIDVVVHPQSVVHSLVEYVDGSVLAQLSPPDMKLPIQYAMSYPQRFPGPARRLDFSIASAWEFQPPDFDRFPALGLGKEAAERGGTTGAVLNAANEAAVQSFLDGEISFTDIPRACRAALDSHDFDPNPTIEQLLALDAWARREVSAWITCC
ncbi:1-deoxy-D-xylulose-5-phosphate reductoisomerase [Blastopirellula retiformator]|uniref:1-deoxy-D-xylulose 5-phosphate reductoisomerase n=1 Tax=Blastopirellula retiformator TaxID=2527970 RepID=A0A5C5V4Q8_9BACT|nr:1-deoxy-D-xylulose-5-phosphate reductoisomerase [Blastopirellula retiformator]TWT32959.1 1-deoxy-D-xylulose 5-phosphate reductoisomerase [Blastopirellula retiformator]